MKIDVSTWTSNEGSYTSIKCTYISFYVSNWYFNFDIPVVKFYDTAIDFYIGDL